MPMQMFGQGDLVQDSSELNADKHMLFQFSSDGYVGRAPTGMSIKIWISPDDLAAQRWDKVNVANEIS